MSDTKRTPASSSLHFGHITFVTGKNGAETALYLGYTLPLSASELSILKAILLSLPRSPSSAELAEATGMPAGQVSVLVNRINRKAFEIGGRRLIIGASHHGFRIFEYA